MEARRNKREAHMTKAPGNERLFRKETVYSQRKDLRH